MRQRESWSAVRVPFVVRGMQGRLSKRWHAGAEGVRGSLGGTPVRIGCMSRRATGFGELGEGGWRAPFLPAWSAQRGARRGSSSQADPSMIRIGYLVDHERPDVLEPG